ncbi:ATP-binding protein [Nocardia sp. NPDC049149]|uniref:ATP-binding protein n=1 Tax=Nocardia sp. NPDC049149 TaxID=3364315 RepID=UPI00372333F0
MTEFRPHAEGHARQVNIAGDNTGTINVVTVHEAPPPLLTITNTLRRDVTTLIGRDAELRRILDAAGRGRVLSIHSVDGMAGVGKTALVTRAAHLLADRFPDGRYFVDLYAHTPGQAPADPAAVLATLLTYLGLDPRSIPDTLAGRRDLWLDRLAGKRVLLVLDDARDHAQIEPLLPVEPGCLVLITSRRRLVALDGVFTMSLETLTPDAAVDLFWDRSQRTPADDDRATVAAIVRRCGYLPLAIVLLAGRLAQHRSWTIVSLADNFLAAQDRLGELEAGPRAVRAAFLMSYADLSPPRQRRFRRLALHPGPDTDAYAAAALDDTTPEAAARDLEALFAEHLIEEIAPGRYRPHDLLREYARELARADPVADRDRAVDRLFDFYCHTADHANQYLARVTRPPRLEPGRVTVPADALRGERQALAWMRTERANLLACLDYATAHDQTARVVRLAGALTGLLDRDGPWPLAIELLQRALGAARRLGDRHAEADALHDIGWLRQRGGDCRTAAELLEQAVLLHRDLADRLGEANDLHYLGVVRQRTGDYRTAADLVRQALAMHREAGNRLGEASALHDLGTIATATGDFSGAVDLLRQALAGYREIGARRGEPDVLRDLGTVLEATGNYAATAEVLRQALAIHRELGDRRGEANDLHGLGSVRGVAGDYPEAAALLEQALALHRELGNQRGEANGLRALGSVRAEAGDAQTAMALLERALDLHRELGDRRGEADALRALGAVSDRIGDSEIGAQMLERALALHREIGNERGEAEARNTIGRLHLGAPRTALGEFEIALEIAARIHSPLEHARALDGIARCRAALGDATSAVPALEQAVVLYRELGSAEADAASDYLAALTALP